MNKLRGLLWTMLPTLWLIVLTILCQEVILRWAETNTAFFLRLLIQAGFNLNVQDNDGWTPLHAAAHWGVKEACSILAEALCDMDIRNKLVSMHRCWHNLCSVFCSQMNINFIAYHLIQRNDKVTWWAVLLACAVEHLEVSENKESWLQEGRKISSITGKDHDSTLGPRL